MTFEVADAEALPFADASFDVVLSTFGVMFAPDHARTAGELLRVTRPGGRIGLANWTPEGFIGELFRVVGKHVPPPAGLRSPALWGTEPHIVELFGAQAAAIQCARRNFAFRYRSAAALDRRVPPLLRADARGLQQRSAEDKREALAADIVALLERRNVGGRGTLVIPGEYLEVVVTRA